MGKEILGQSRVLRLNSAWQPFDTCTVQEAFVAMSRIRQKHYSEKMKRPYNALHVEFPIVDMKVDYSQIISLIPVEMKDWIELPVRFYDNYLSTPSKFIRIPTIIIAQNYNSIPNFSNGFSKNRLWQRDNSTCQLTGEKVNKKTGNIEHRIPRKKGGKTSYTNCYVVKKELNRKKKDLMPEEFYLRYGYPDPLSKLKTPQKDKIIIVNTYDIPDWYHFPNVVKKL